MKARHVTTRVMQNAPDLNPVHLAYSLLQNIEGTRVKEKERRREESEKKKDREAKREEL